MEISWQETIHVDSFGDLIKDERLKKELEETLSDEINLFAIEHLGKDVYDTPYNLDWVIKQDLTRSLEEYLANFHNYYLYDIITDCLPLHLGSHGEFTEWYEEHQDSNQYNLNVYKVAPSNKEEFLSFIVDHIGKYPFTEEELKEQIVLRKL